MQRIAVPMIGGMVSSTLLTLIVIPTIYALIKRWRLPKVGSIGTVDDMPDATFVSLDVAAECMAKLTS